jgi:hypothetical protein
MAKDTLLLIPLSSWKNIHIVALPAFTMLGIKAEVVIFLRVKSGRRVRLTALPISVGQLSRICGILDVSQAYGPPRLLAGIAFHFTNQFYTKFPYRCKAHTTSTFLMSDFGCLSAPFTASVVWWSEWLLTQRSRVRFLSSNVSGAGSTQPLWG